MAKIVFKELPLNQPELFPQNLFDRIPSNHPARIVSEVVDGLDITSLMAQYKGGGTSSYHPRMMLKVLFYSYLCNVYSCRKIEKALQENIAFMWIAGSSTPDFRTINYFRGKRLKGEIHQLFAGVVRMLQELGYVSLDVQYVDGTKIESASNRYTFVWRGSVEKNKAKLEQKVRVILGEIESQIREDDQEGCQQVAPTPLDKEALRSKLAELNSRLKEPSKATQKQLRQLQEEHLPKLEQYQDQLKAMGSRNSYSKTDRDATFMRMKEDHMKNGQLKPAYNPQISTENQLITHYSVHQTPGDTTTLIPHLNTFRAAYGRQSQVVVADGGYGSQENYEYLEANGVQAFVKYSGFHAEQKRSARNNPFLLQNLYYNQQEDYYVCPMGQHLTKAGTGQRVSSTGYASGVSYYQAAGCSGCPLRGQCHRAKGNRMLEVNHRLLQLREDARKRLTSEEGVRHRGRRAVEPEAVFGQLKSNNRFNRFTMRGLDMVNLEFGLMALAHNLRKLAEMSFFLGKSALFRVLTRLCLVTLMVTSFVTCSRSKNIVCQ